MSVQEIDPKIKKRNDFIVTTIISSLRIILGSLSVLLGGLDLDNCDNYDDSGLNVSAWLIAYGIIELVANLHIIINNTLVYVGYIKKSWIVVKIIAIFYYLMNPIWLVIGAVILFRSNQDCIRSHSGHVLYALTIWCTYTLHFIVFVVTIIYKIIAALRKKIYTNQ